MKIAKDSALVVVDMLYDFIEGGSLACHHSVEAVAETLKFIDTVTDSPSAGQDAIESRFPILFVCDHHPADHCSFVSEGGTWPSHCVQDTRGGEVHDDLKPYVSEEFTFYKGYKKDKEQYSGFEGINEAGQSLYDVLDIMDIRNVYVCGIATEYCVRQTCEDIRKAGFNVFLLKDAIGYVDPEGHAEALKAMEAECIELV